MDEQQTRGDLYETGLEIRREVLGREHVARSLAAASDFARPVQELVTTWCWGEIWGRPGLDRRTRSLLNLAMLTSLNRMHEFGVHVKGAIENGVTREEILEVIMQAAIYVGVPAALESTRTAEKAFAELDAQS
jgi:4-carboxymuconolactone decarboxylase